jgi:hypothetical protein
METLSALLSIFRGKKKTKRSVKQTGSVMEKYAMLKLRENQLMEVYKQSRKAREY